MKTMSTGVALAALVALAFTAPQAANAAGHHHKRMHMKRVRLIPSQPKPYHSLVGTPSLIDPVPVAAGGGLLGLGVIPSTGAFKGVPVLGDIGL